jgi:hypothetical protein
MAAEDPFDFGHEDPAVVGCSRNKVVGLAGQVETDIRARNTRIDAQEAVGSQEKPDLVAHADALSAQKNIDSRGSLSRASALIGTELLAHREKMEVTRHHWTRESLSASQDA